MPGIRFRGITMPEDDHVGTLGDFPERSGRAAWGGAGGESGGAKIGHAAELVGQFNGQAMGVNVQCF